MEGPVPDPQPVLLFVGGLDHLVLNHIGGTPFRMWDGDVEHTRWLMQVGFCSRERETPGKCRPGATPPTLTLNKGEMKRSVMLCC